MLRPSLLANGFASALALVVDVSLLSLADSSDGLCELPPGSSSGAPPFFLSCFREGFVGCSFG